MKTSQSSICLRPYTLGSYFLNARLMMDQSARSKVKKQ